MKGPTREALESQRDHAADDLIALRQQLDAGEVDPEAAARLEQRYQTEIADALSALDAIDADRRPRSSRRALVAVGLFSVAAAIVVVALVNAVDPPGGSSADGVDLSTVSNVELEEVVAANPDILPMRLALARRYVEAGEFSAALPHYMYVLERERNAEALMYVGWMTYLSGDPGTGAGLLEESLAVRPGDPLASWFLANAIFHGLGEPEGAIPHLETVLESREAPPDIAAEAQRMLDEALGS